MSAPDSPLHAALSERDGTTLISLEGTTVATANSQPQAIGILCSEALRRGRALVVEVPGAGGRRHLQVSATGHATWSAGPVPTGPVDRGSRGRPSLAVPQPSTANPRVVAQPKRAAAAPVDAASNRRRLLAAATTLTCAATLTWGGAGTYANVSAANDLRDQTLTLTQSPPVTPAALTQLQQALPADLTRQRLVDHVTRTAHRHHVDVTAASDGKSAASEVTSSAGSVIHQQVTIEVTLTGSRADVANALTELATSRPLVSVAALQQVGSPVATTTTVTLTGHGAGGR